MTNQDKKQALEETLKGYVGEKTDIDDINQLKIRPNGYYKDFSNVKADLEFVINLKGHFPKRKELKELGLFALINSFTQYHDNINSVRRRMGHPIVKQDSGYWNFENTLKECVELKKKYGSLPSQPQLKKLKKLSLIQAINNHGGMNFFRKKLGDEILERPKGYWKNFSNCKNEYLALTKKLKHPPINKELIKLKYGGLADSINKNFYGLNVFRERIGLTNKKKPNYYWTDKKIIKECRRIIKEKGYLPSIPELIKENKYGSLIGGISANGGYMKFREILGFPLETKPDNYWDKDNTFNEAKKVYERLGYLPSSNKLGEMNENSLVSAIIRHFGFPQLRKKLDRIYNKKTEILRQPNGYWTEERILNECRKLVKKYGDLPSYSQMKKLGYTALGSTICKFKKGAFRYIREKLGLSQITKEPGYWDDPENIINEITNVIKDNHLTEFPSSTFLQTNGYSYIYAAIKNRYDGYDDFTDRYQGRFSFYPNALEKLLEDYAE